jgi:hypothetical protein
MPRWRLVTLPSLGCAFPIFLLNGHPRIRPHRLGGIHQPPDGAEAEARLVEGQGLIGRGQVRAGLGEGLGEETGQRRQFRAVEPQLLRGVGLVALRDRAEQRRHPRFVLRQRARQGFGNGTGFKKG